MNDLAGSDLRCQLLLTLECFCETVFVFWVGVSMSQPAVTMEMQPGQDSMVPLILNAGESQSLQLSPTSPPLSLSQVQYDQDVEHLPPARSTDVRITRF